MDILINTTSLKKKENEPFLLANKMICLLKHEDKN